MQRMHISHALLVLYLFLFISVFLYCGGGGGGDGDTTTPISTEQAVQRILHFRKEEVPDD